MVVRRGKISKTRQRKRRSHFGLSRVQLVSCANCGGKIKSHEVCLHCGYYKGKQELKKKTKEKKKERK